MLLRKWPWRIDLTDQASRWVEHRLSLLDRGIRDHVSSLCDFYRTMLTSLQREPRACASGHWETAHLQIIVTLLAMADTRNSAEFAFTHVRV